MKILYFILLILSGCTKIDAPLNNAKPLTSEVSDDTVANKSNVRFQNLEKSGWRIIEINQKSIAIPEASDDTDSTRFSLSFAGGQYAGSSGCNSFGGIYVQNAELIFTAIPMATQMGCPGNQEEEIFALFSIPIQMNWRADGLLELSNSKSQLLLKRSDNLCFQCSSKQMPNSETQLTGSKWRVQTINGIGPTNAAKSDWKIANLEFHGINLRLAIGCNTINGQFQQTDKQLQTNNIVSTAQSCGPKLDAEDRLVYAIIAQSPWIAFGPNNDMIMGNSNGVLELKRIDIVQTK